MLNGVLVVLRSLHMMFQWHTCQLGELSKKYGYVQHSFFWQITDQYPALYCAAPPYNGFVDGKEPVALQDLLNMRLKMDELVGDGIARGDDALRANFYDGSIKAIKRANNWTATYYGRHKCGTVHCEAPSTAQEIAHDTFIQPSSYGPSSQHSDEYFSSSYNENDCPFELLIWATAYNKTNGVRALHTYEPTCQQWISATTCADGPYPANECQVDY